MSGFRTGLVFGQMASVPFPDIRNLDMYPNFERKMSKSEPKCIYIAIKRDRVWFKSSKICLNSEPGSVWNSAEFGRWVFGHHCSFNREFLTKFIMN